MVSFVILHYKNFSDTIECIESIRNNISYDQKKISIIVVDNNTLSKEEEKQLKKYTKDLVLLNENKGFANGNNAGCKYAIEKYNPAFLCVINNDTVIDQKDFIDEIYDAYDKYNFDIMGPKIITNGGDSVNPFYAYETVEEINKKIKYHTKLLKIYSNKLLRFLLKIYMNIKHVFMKNKHLENGKETKTNVALHGCALIFSKKYYKKYDDVFYKGTFLYHEEEFLNYRKNKDKLITLYNKDLEIFHKEGSSLNLSFKDNYYDKLIFRNKEIIRSLSLLKDVILNNKDI